MKGIILAAGKGTRLYPITHSVCKPLLPVYDKPMIFYPLSLLLKLRITEILIIVPEGDEEQFKRLLGDGGDFGVKISYIVQYDRRGIADAFILGEKFLDGDSVCLCLGDNIFFGEDFTNKAKIAASLNKKAGIFGLYMDDPRAFGVVEFDEDGKALSIEEKPENPKSNYIVPGLYFYDNSVCDVAKKIKPSKRGELEITAVNNYYLEQGELNVVSLEKDISWFDTGNANSLLDAAMAIKNYRSRGGRPLGVLEESAYRAGLITKEELQKRGESLKASDYGEYILKIAKEAQ